MYSDNLKEESKKEEDIMSKNLRLNTKVQQKEVQGDSHAPTAEGIKFNKLFWFTDQ